MSGSLGLDLGSTNIKAGYFDERGCLLRLERAPSPALSGSGAIRESDPDAYVEIARNLILALDAPRGVPLGVSTQRSSFVLWRRDNGAPVTPLISWQDLRAGEWRRKNRDRCDWSLTGLPLSPHYAAPKLAFLFENDPVLNRMAQNDELLFGTLDVYLVWRWTEGACHEIDLSVAARTLLVDLGQRDWSTARLTALGVPRKMLPRIRACRGFSHDTVLGYPIAATVADQAAGALPLFFCYPDCANINAGTGTFIMRRRMGPAPEGYVSAMLGETPLDRHTILWEGAINAGARLLESVPELTNERLDDPSRVYRAVPDDAGLGAPYWRDDLSGYLSPEFQRLDPEKRGQILVRTFLFRIRQVLEGLFPNEAPAKILITGGLAARDDLLGTLAGFLPRAALFAPEEPELGLLGAAWLAARTRFELRIPLRTIHSTRASASFESEYHDWLAWLNQLCHA